MSQLNLRWIPGIKLKQVFDPDKSGLFFQKKKIRKQSQHNTTTSTTTITASINGTTEKSTPNQLETKLKDKSPEL